MNARALRRYIDDLLRGRRPKPFRPDDFEAAQIRTAIDLQAARLGSDAPRQEFLTDLHRRLAEQQEGTARRGVEVDCDPQERHRRHVGSRGGRGGGGIYRSRVDRWWPGRRRRQQWVPASSRRTTGRWMRVAASADVPDGVMRPFDVGSVIGFVRRVDGKAEAVSGVCTHQGCRLWFDAPDDRLRCPCHSTSFAPAGQVLTHQLPIAPKPLPTLMVREQNGAIEVFVPAPPSEPA